MKKPIVLLVLLISVITVTALKTRSTATAAVVVPSDPAQELYERIRAKKKVRAVAQVQLAANSNSVLIEGHKAAKPAKVFNAAQFVCRLPLETGTYTTICKEPAEAEAAMKIMKERGFDEIRLKTPATGKVYDAIVKSARELEMRINA
jgi:hypothetical protein